MTSNPNGGLREEDNFPFIYILRGVAVLGVVLVHVGQRTPEWQHFHGVSEFGKYGV